MVKISLFDLEPKKAIYAKLSESLVLWLVRKAKEKKQYQKSAQEFLRLIRGNKCSLEFAIQICKKMGISDRTLKENIELLTSCKSTDVGIRRPNTPFDFSSEEGARFIAGIMGDGHINNQLCCGYSNQQKEMVEKILSSSEKIFGKIDSRLYFGKDNTFHLDFPKISGLIIIRTGLSPGFKHKTNPKIPEFIFDKDKKIKAAFLKQFFSDEGNVRLKDRRLQVKQTVSVKASKDAVKVRPEKFYPNVLIGCQKLLSDFGIDSKLSLGAYRITPHGKKTDWELSFYRIENLKIFQKEIGFEQEYKNQLLEKAVKSYKFPSTARNKKLEFALEKCRRAEEKFGFIDKKKLAEESNRSLKTATYYLVELKKKGLVEIISKPKRKDGRYRLFKYKTKQ